MLQEIDMRAAFIKTLSESPNDEVARGMYADWLADQGDSQEATIRNPFGQRTKTRDGQICLVADPGSRWASMAFERLHLNHHYHTGLQYVLRLVALREVALGPLRWHLEAVLHHQLLMQDRFVLNGRVIHHGSLWQRATDLSREAGLPFVAPIPQYRQICE